jgi:hypothetical protein
MTFFYILVISFNSWLNRKQQQVTMSSTLNLLCRYFGWNIWRKSDLTCMCHDLLWIFLVVHQNPTWNSLSSSWNVEFIPVKFLNSVTLEHTGPPSTLNGYFTQVWFASPRIEYLTELCSSSKCWHIHYAIWNKPVITITTNLIRKVF